jgi:hypothetical protein
VASDRREAVRYRTLETAYTAAISRRLDTSGDLFHMEIDAVRHTTRVEAGQALLQRARAVIHDAARHRGDTHEVPARTIGRLAGFILQIDGYKLGQTLEARIAIVLDDNHTIILRLTPDHLHDKKPDALIGQLEGPIRKLDDKLAAAQRMATQFATQATEAETRCGQPFPDQGRLDHLRRRYQQILDELNTEADPARPAPLHGGRPPAPPTTSIVSPHLLTTSRRRSSRAEHPVQSVRSSTMLSPSSG